MSVYTHSDSEKYLAVGAKNSNIFYFNLMKQVYSVFDRAELGEEGKQR